MVKKHYSLLPSSSHSRDIIHKPRSCLTIIITAYQWTSCSLQDKTWAEFTTLDMGVHASNKTA